MSDVNQQEIIESRSKELAEGFVKEINKPSKNRSLNTTLLYDLKTDTINQAVLISDIDIPTQEIIEFADILPDFEISSFYRARSSFFSIGLAVIIGWIVGGFLSTILGIFSLGGEIFRPLCIFGFIWLEDYFSSNPKARLILLTTLGLGGLTKFAASLTLGFVRLTSLSSIRSLIFGSMPKPGILKSAWLWLGAIFVIAFFAKKPAGIDLAALQQSLSDQIQQRMKFAIFFLTQLEEKNKIIADIKKEDSESSTSHDQINNELALSLINMLPQLSSEARKYLTHKLVEAGYSIPEQETDIIIWNEERDRSQYETLGLVREGNRCKVLKSPVMAKDKLIKGLVQRLSLT